MAEAVDIIETKLDSSALTQGTHVIQNGHVIGDEQGIKNYVSGLSASREELNAKLEALIKKQKDAAKAKNEDYNHSFVALNIKSHTVELLTPQQADKFIQASPEIDTNTATTAGAAGVTLSAVDSAFKQHNPLAEGIEAQPEVQPEQFALQASAQDIENGANGEYYGYWAEAKNNEISDFDPNIFKEPLSEEALISNSSFQDAAKILYNNDRGEGDPTWAEHVLAQGWSKERAAEELGQWGHDHMHDFNYDTFSGISVANNSSDGERNVQLATLYMMQAYDHKDVTAGSFASAAWTAVTDPVNIGFILLGVAGAAFSGGTSLAAAGAAVTARQTAGMMARKAAMTLIGDSVKKNIARGVIGGGVESYLDDRYVRFRAEKDGFKALGKEEKAQYTLQRGATNTALGAVIGGGITSIPHGVKQAVNTYQTRRNNKEVAKVWDEAHLENALFDENRMWDEALAENAAFDENRMLNEAYDENTRLNERDIARVWDEAHAENALFDENRMWDEALAENAAFDARNASLEQSNVVYHNFNNAAQNTGSGVPHAQPHQNIPQQILDAIARGETVEYTDSNTSFKVGQNSSNPGTQTRAQTISRTGNTEADHGISTKNKKTSSDAVDESKEESPTKTTRADTSTEESFKPAPKVDNKDNLLPDPKTTWWHHALSGWNPYIGIGRLFPKVSDPSKNLSNDLAFDAYILPFINEVDKQLSGKAKGLSNTSNIMKPLNDELNDITSRINSGMHPLSVEEAQALSEKVIKKFLKSNKNKLNDLSKALAPIAEEIRMERELAVLNRKVSEKINVEDARGATKEVNLELSEKGKIEADFNRIIESYESRTGHTFHNKEGRLKAILSGSSRMFHLEDRQAGAMLDYINALQNSIGTIKSDDFIDTYRAEINRSLNSTASEDPNEIRRAFQYHFSFLTKESEDAVRRSDPANRGAQESIWDLRSRSLGQTRDRLQDINSRRIALRQGYFNPHRREGNIANATQMDNIEAVIMDIEDMAPKDASKASEVIGLIKQGYNFQQDHEIIEAMKRLNMRAGKEKHHQLLDAINNELTRGPDYTGASQHYKYFVNTIKEVTSVPHSPYRWGQRDMQKATAVLSYKPHHARKFPGGGNVLSTPGRMFFLEDPIAYAGRGVPTYFLGGRFERIKNEQGEWVDQYNIWNDAPEDATGFAWAKHHAYDKILSQPLRAARNTLLLPIKPGYELTKMIGKNGVVRDVIMYPGGAALMLAGTEGALEYVLPEDTWFTDEEGNLIVPEAIPGIGGAHFDIGSRLNSMVTIPVANAALAPIRWNIELADQLIDEEEYFDIKSEWLSLYGDGLFGYVPVSKWNASVIGDRGNLSTTETLELINSNPKYHTYIDADKLAAATAMAGAGDIEQENIEGYLKAAQDARVKAQSAPQEQPVVSGKKDDTSEKDSANESNKEKPNGSPEVRDSNSYSSTTFNNVADKGSDLLGSVGGGLSSIFEGAFPNSGISTALSSTFNWAGDTFSQMKNGQISGGQKVLAYGGAAAAAIMFVPWITSKLDFLGSPGNPSMLGGLLSIAGIFLAIGYGGRMALDMMTGQGDDLKVPKVLKDWARSAGSNDDKSDKSTKDKPSPVKKIIPDTAIQKLGDGDTAYITEGAIEGDGKIGIGLVQNVVGQQKGKVISAPLAMQIVSAETAAANASIASINDLRNNGRIIKSDALGHYAGKDKAEGGGEVIDIGTGKQYSFHSLNGTMDDKDLVAVEYDLKAG